MRLDDMEQFLLDAEAEAEGEGDEDEEGDDEDEVDDEREEEAAAVDVDDGENERRNKLMKHTLKQLLWRLASYLPAACFCPILAHPRRGARHGRKSCGIQRSTDEWYVMDPNQIFPNEQRSCYEAAHCASRGPSMNISSIGPCFMGTSIDHVQVGASLIQHPRGEDGLRPQGRLISMSVP